MGDCRLYLISPLDVSGGFAQRLERALDAGGPVAAFQFRVKRLDQHEAGADFLAVSHAVWGGDEADAVRAFAARLG